jgi:TonB-dependent Receptor Plug Domain
MKLIKLSVLLSFVLLNTLCLGKSQKSIADSVSLIEKVYLHTDRSTYYNGEDLWFKAYLIDAMDHSLTNHSSNLHVELISPALKIISNRIVRIDSGLGDGDFKLPLDIHSGKYKLRAYTNYMRNFSDQLFFTKEITIVNAKDGQAEVSDKVNYVKNKISLDFFPEGGSLINNVSSNVAFKAVNSLGIGCDVSGNIFSSKGDLITKFKSSHLGMGSFFLKPLPGLSYYSIFRSADSMDIRVDLPASFPKGVTLSASLNQDKEILITTKTNSETLALVSEHDLQLSISIRNEVINTIPLKIKSLVTSFVVPTGYLPDGILMLTLSTLNDLPLAERLIYIEREPPLNIQIETDKHVYNKREPVTLKISLSEDSIVERTSNVSLAVVNETFINNPSKFPRTISSWFLLESDVRGTIEDPSYYFDQSNPDRLRDLDLLLRTQGWRDFAWKYDTTYFPPENGFTVSGRLRKGNKNKPIEDSRVSIGIFGSKSSLVKSVPVDSTGKFKLSDIDFTGKATLIATGIGKKDHLEGVLTLDSVTYNPPKAFDSSSVVSIMPENDQSKLKSYYKINEAKNKKYKLFDTVNIGEVTITPEPHKDHQTEKIEASRIKYVKPEAELVVTEVMLGYNDMLQLLKGKIPGLVVIGDSTISIRGEGKQPLILIDGNQATFNDLVIMPIFIVDRIDVLKSWFATNIYGFLAVGGVINVITKAGGVPPVYIPVKYSANIKISGYSASRVFYSPKHLPDSKSDLLPDLRSTLYWKPDINLEGTNEVILNYFNGDNASIIRIIAEGITKDGIPITGTVKYEIR